MSRSTPWGAAHHIVKHLKGVSTVTTSSHGGMMISRGFAEKNLSTAARDRALKYGNYLCFEEDATVSIALLELKAFWKNILSYFNFAKGLSADQIEENLILDLSGTNPDYLVEIGVEPRGEAYECYLMRLEAEKAYAAKSPNLIISAFGSHKNLVPGVLEVITADGRSHLVTEKSYNALYEDKVQGLFKRLDKTEIVDMPVSSVVDRLVPFAIEASKPYLALLESDMEMSQRELNGVFIGPRTRYNGYMNTVKESFIKLVRAERQVSFDEANRLFNSKIMNIKDGISKEFHSCKMFQRMVFVA